MTTASKFNQNFWGRRGGFIFYNFRSPKKVRGVFIFYKNSQKTEGFFLFFSKSKLPKSRFLSVSASVYPQKFSGAPSARTFFHFPLGIPPKIFRRAFGAHFYSISPWYTEYIKILRMTPRSESGDRFGGFYCFEISSSEKVEGFLLF